MTRAGLFRNGFCAVLALVTGGCIASEARYPSLERWPAERLSAQPEAAASDAAQTPSGPTAAVAARIAQLLEQARGAQSAFKGKQAAAERAVAAGGAAGSDTWARASVAVAELETAHDPAVQALAALDQMEVDNRTQQAGVENADTAAIVAARNEVSDIVDDQATVLARLRARLS